MSPVRDFNVNTYVLNIFISFEFVRTAPWPNLGLNKVQGPKRRSCDNRAATRCDQRRKVGNPVQAERGFPPSTRLLGVWLANASYISPFSLPPASDAQQHDHGRAWRAHAARDVLLRSPRGMWARPR